VTADLFHKLSAVAAVKAATPGAEALLLVLEETAGSSGGGCDNVTDRMVAGFCWMNTLMTVGRAGFDRVHRQDIAGWSFAFGSESRGVAPRALASLLPRWPRALGVTGVQPRTPGRVLGRLHLLARAAAASFRRPFRAAHARTSMCSHILRPNPSVPPFSSPRAVSHYQLVGPPGWVVGSDLLTPHPDYFTTLLWRQLVGARVLAANTSAASVAGLLDAAELGVWCAAPATSPFGAGAVVLTYTLAFGASDVAVALPPALAAAASARYFLSAPGDDLQSDALLLNGALLALGAGGALAAYPIAGRAAAAGAPLVLPHASYGFVAFDARVAACA